MGFDFQFIAYLGAPQTDAQLDALIRERVRGVQLFRHARAPLAQRKDLHFIALYSAVNDPPPPPKRSSDGPSETSSLSQLVQAAWKETLASELHADSQREVGLNLARQLSRQVDGTFWVAQGDHACVGGFAQFKRGKVVAQAGEDGVWVEGEDYLRVPERLWTGTLGAPLTPEATFLRAFGDSPEPPLRKPGQADVRIAFDPARFEVSLD